MIDCIFLVMFFIFNFFILKIPGDMMMSILWYYRPEHTESGRKPEEDLPDEIFASKHKDNMSVACIEDRCYVLTFNEYCR